jgi:hypothetical protein
MALLCYCTEYDLVTGPVTTGGENVNPWWWVPIGLAAWCLVAVVMALCIGRVLRRASQARESVDRQLMELSDRDDPYTLNRNSTHSQYDNTSWSL